MCPSDGSSRKTYGWPRGPRPQIRFRPGVFGNTVANWTGRGPGKSNARTGRAAARQTRRSVRPSAPLRRGTPVRRSMRGPRAGAPRARGRFSIPSLFMIRRRPPRSASPRRRGRITGSRASRCRFVRGRELGVGLEEGRRGSTIWRTGRVGHHLVEDHVNRCRAEPLHDRFWSGGTTGFACRRTALRSADRAAREGPAEAVHLMRRVLLGHAGSRDSSRRSSARRTGVAAARLPNLPATAGRRGRATDDRIALSPAPAAAQERDRRRDPSAMAAICSLDARQGAARRSSTNSPAREASDARLQKPRSTGRSDPVADHRQAPRRVGPGKIGR